MRARKLERKPNEQFNRTTDITRDIGGLEIAIGRHLFVYERGIDNLYSTVLIEGYSKAFNFIYGRIEQGYPVGRPLEGNIGEGAVYLLPSHLEGFEVICALG